MFIIYLNKKQDVVIPQMKLHPCRTIVLESNLPCQSHHPFWWNPNIGAQFPSCIHHLAASHMEVWHVDSNIKIMNQVFITPLYLFIKSILNPHVCFQLFSLYWPFKLFSLEWFTSIVNQGGIFPNWYCWKPIGYYYFNYIFSFFKAPYLYKV